MSTTVTRLGIAQDMPTWAPFVAVGLVVLSLGLLMFELRRGDRARRVLVASTHALAALALLGAVLRPVRVASSESIVGPRVVVLADTSRSLALRDGDGTRVAARDHALEAVKKAAPGARLTVLGFGEGKPAPLLEGPPQAGHSDLRKALGALADSAEERPAALVVISDGRLDDPPEDATTQNLAELFPQTAVHTVATTRRVPKDASVRRVSAAGAVAHVPLPLRVELGCAGGLSCSELTVVARELREDGPPALLASGIATVKDGKAVVDLTVTFERAGPRVLEVSVTAPEGDEIPENDKRFLTFNVARERIRVLHVAGRPTNDVRALRQWLKSDASVDLVAFFILRTPTDNPNATNDELALIPFPVDELFSEHLPSFDAVVLQDFDAQPYNMERHLPALAKYVRAGGGLVMVGGPNSFVAGGYADTPLADVLPVKLSGSAGATSADTAKFVPVYTDEGRDAPLLAPLRKLLGDELPEMPGANVLGDVRPGAIALLRHPTRSTASGTKMPLLAIGEQGDGRSIALALDGAWQLQFSELGAQSSGRGYGALWDGLLGWLMRDPRFEPAELELVSSCVADVPAKLRIRAPRSTQGGLSLEIAKLGSGERPARVDTSSLDLASARGASLEIPLPKLGAGGYTVRARIGNAPTTRRDFACEAGGDEWADSRPDGERLERLAKATKGSFSWADSSLSIPLPKPTVVAAERHVTPLAPAWVWTLLAAVTLGASWLARRRSGLV